MKNRLVHLSTAIVILCIFIMSCDKSDQPEIPLTTYPPHQNQSRSVSEPNAVSNTPPQDEPDKNKDVYLRTIVVDEHNNVFPIGTLASQNEQTEVNADKPVDFWFEYLPEQVKLEINGKEIQRDTMHWELKIGYTKSVTKFSYCIYNTTGGDIAYILHIVPSSEGDSVPVIVRQRWITQ